MNLATFHRTQTLQPLLVSQPRPQQPGVAQSPDAMLDAWTGKLQYITLQAHPQVLELLSNVSKGLVSSDNEAAAQGVFNVLLQHEEFEVFAELFEAYNRVQADKFIDPDTGVSAFVRSLTLQLPKHWTPERTSPEAMLKVFERIHVDKMVVVAPDALSPVPASMGPCIQALLKSGKTTSLAVHGLLRPGFIGETAFAHSALRSVELDGDAPPNVLRLAFTDLMASLAKCTTLKHLALKHAAFAQLHPHIGKFESSLEAIQLIGRDPGVDDAENATVETEHLKMFVQTIAAISTLSVLELKVALHGPDLIADHAVTSLKGHPALTSLSIREVGTDRRRIDAQRFEREFPLMVEASPILENIVHEFGRHEPMPTIVEPAMPQEAPWPPLEVDSAPDLDPRLNLDPLQDAEPAAVTEDWPTNAPAA